MQTRIRIVAIFCLALTACGSEHIKRPDFTARSKGQGDSNPAPPSRVGSANGGGKRESTPQIIETQITPLVPTLNEITKSHPADPNESTVSKDTPIDDSSETIALKPELPPSPETPVLPTAPTETPPDPSNPIAEIPEQPLIPQLPPEPTAPLPRIPTPSLPPAPALLPPLIVDTYESALAEINQYRSDIAPFKADNAAASASGTVWLGDGVNVLNGERTPSCLNLGTLSKQTNRINQTQDNFEFVNNYYDFWKKMGTSTSLGGSGTFPSFTLGLSASADTSHDVFTTKDDIVAVASFNYKREEQTLYNARPAFAPYFSTTLNQNKGLFRMLCGDSFTKSVSLGGSMRIVFNAKKRDNKDYKKTAIKAALNLGFTNLFSVNSSFAFNKEQQEILKSYSFSMKCYTAGTRANICADFGLNTSFNFDADGVSLQHRMDEARKRMAADVDKGESLVIVDEKIASYEAPISSCTLSGEEACPAPEKIYYDYRPRVDTAFRILSTLETTDEICRSTPYWKNRCNSVKKQLTAAMRSCSQSNTPCAEVKDREQLEILLSARNPGSFSLWTDIDRRADIYSADFSGGDAEGRFASNTFYIFSDMGWDRLNDRASSAEVHLARGWKVRFWEHKQSDRRGNSIDLQNNDYVSNLWKMNDKFSAFELIPPSDLGE